MPKFYFTSESVTSGHPDKVCDLIADSILDEALRQDPTSHMAVEATIKDDLILVYGEAGTNAVIDYEKIALQVMKEIGYNEEYHVLVKVNKQSSEINGAVAHDEISAGDQGIMFGYADDETEELMPYAIITAHKLTKKLEEVRRQTPFLRPDGKTQVTAEYVDGKLTRVDTIVVSTQHTADEHKKKSESASRNKSLIQSLIHLLLMKIQNISSIHPVPLYLAVPGETLVLQAERLL